MFLYNIYIYIYIHTHTHIYIYICLNDRLWWIWQNGRNIWKVGWIKWFIILSMSNNSIWPINRTLSGATTVGQSGSGSDGSEGVLCIPQSSSITGISPSDSLVSYLGHSLWGSYPLCREAINVFYSPRGLGSFHENIVVSLWHFQPYLMYMGFGFFK